jgi:hypothetical protein
MIISNASQADAIRNRETALHAWLGNRTSYHPSELPVDINPPTNEERSALECFEFMRDKPAKYFLYVSEKTKLATTFTGDTLGTVTFGREYRDNFGGKRVAITVKAITGETYHGTFYKSSGDYARIVKSIQRETFTMSVEYTDTYAGQANYNWVKRATLTLPVKATDRQIMRAAKLAVGISGLRGRVSSYGDGFEFRPYGVCAVLFITTDY